MRPEYFRPWATRQLASVPLDDKIELNRRMSETLEAMARALLQSWFVDFDPVRENMKRRDAKAQGRQENQESLASSRPGAPALNEN